MKFVMFDIEALGPPGVGEIFALGAVRFDPGTGRILDRFSRNVRPGSGLGGELRATCDTLRWALAQSPSVLDQLPTRARLHSDDEPVLVRVGELGAVHRRARFDDGAQNPSDHARDLGGVRAHRAGGTSAGRAGHGRTR